MTNNIKKIAAVYISAIFKFQIILSFRILLFFSSNDECICSSKQTNVKNAHRSVHFRLKTKLLGALPQTLFRELFEKSSLKTLKNFYKIICFWSYLYVFVYPSNGNSGHLHYCYAYIVLTAVLTECTLIKRSCCLFAGSRR